MLFKYTSLKELKSEYDKLPLDSMKLRRLEFKYKILEFEYDNVSNVLNDFMNILNKLQADPTNEKNLLIARDMLQNMGVDLL